MFVDQVKIIIQAGNGGDGCRSFRREKYVPRGGPNGGDGGKGGDIVLRTDRNLTTLLDLRYQQLYRAEHGRPGKGKLMTGRSGRDSIIKVPIGTLVKDYETGELFTDLCEEFQEYIAACGGMADAAIIPSSPPPTVLLKGPTRALPAKRKSFLLN